MNLQPIFQKLYPEGSIGGQCGSFCHKLYAADSHFPLLPMFLGSKLLELHRSGFPAPQTISVGDIVLFSYQPFGHLAVVNNIIGENLQLTESNFNYDLRVQHTRQISANSPLILGVWKGTPLYQVPVSVPVIQIKLVQNGEAWSSMPAKFAEVRSRILEASNNQFDINIDVDYVSFPTVPYVGIPEYPASKGIEQAWMAQNILPHINQGRKYNLICFLDDRTKNGALAGASFGWTYYQGSIICQVLCGEEEILTFKSPTTGQYDPSTTMNLFVNAFIHECLGHGLKLMDGEWGGDLTHQYLYSIDPPFDLKGLYSTLNYQNIQSYIN